MKKICLILTLLVLPLVGIYAQQTDAVSASDIKPTERKLAPEGTFLLIPKSKTMEVFTVQYMLDIREMVEKNRKEDTENTIYLSIYTDILILPRKVIEDKDFRPFQSLYE